MAELAGLLDRLAAGLVSCADGCLNGKVNVERARGSLIKQLTFTYRPAARLDGRQGRQDCYRCTAEREYAAMPHSP